MEAIEILMVDDEKENFDSLKNFAAKQSVQLRHTTNLEDALITLNENKNIVGIILDGRGFLKRDQQKGTESTNFVHQALTEIALLEKRNNMLYAKVVFTAWKEQLQESLEDRVVVYDKKKLAINEKLRTEMFLELKKFVTNSSRFKIKLNYKVYFEMFNDKYLPKISEEKLFTILTLAEENKMNFNEIRNLLESIFYRLGGADLSFLPNNLFNKDGRPILGHIIQYLKGDRIIGSQKNILYERLDKTRAPKHIAYGMEYLKQISSTISHNYNEIYTLNAYKSAIYSLLESMLWLKKIVDEN